MVDRIQPTQQELEAVRTSIENLKTLRRDTERLGSTGVQVQPLLDQIDKDIREAEGLLRVYDGN